MPGSGPRVPANRYPRVRSPSVLNSTVRHERDDIEPVNLRDGHVHDEGHGERCARGIPATQTHGEKLPPRATARPT
jgi:hypothetical protein